MPIYEFHCEACGDDFEALCHMGGDADEVCPSCGSGKVTKLWSTFVGRSSAGEKVSCPVAGPDGRPPCGAGATCALRK